MLTIFIIFISRKIVKLNKIHYIKKRFHVIIKIYIIIYKGEFS